MDKIDDIKADEGSETSVDIEIGSCAEKTSHSDVSRHVKSPQHHLLNLHQLHNHRPNKLSIVEMADDRASGAGSFLCLPVFHRDGGNSQSNFLNGWFGVSSHGGLTERWSKVLDSSIQGLLDLSQHTKDGNQIEVETTLNLGDTEKSEDYTKAYTEHEMSLVELSRVFNTSIDTKNPSKSVGLTDDQAKRMLNKFGKNMISPPVRTPLWLLFLLQFTNMFMVLLLVAAMLSIVTWCVHPAPKDPMNLYLGIFLIFVVIMTCYSTYNQEAKSDELMEQFKAMVPSVCSAIRNGITRVVRAEELVVGDILWLKTGDKVPADCRVIQNTGMRVDQSMLTGESEPVESSEEPHDPSALEARNIIFSGSLIVDGGALVTVIRTADQTLLGSMVRLTGDMGKRESTLKADVNAFVWVITKIAVAMATFIFIIGISRGLPVFQTLLDGFIVTIIANMPCGLPSTVTACLFIVAERMGKQKVFVKKLDVIETLGSCSLICTDKTGTLTENRMSVSHVWLMGTAMNRDSFRESCRIASRVPINPVANAAPESTSFQLPTDSTAEILPSTSNTVTVRNHARVITLLEIAVLNSRVTLEAQSGGDIPRECLNPELSPTGDATELGLYRYLSTLVPECTGVDIEEFRTDRPKVYEIPFSSSNKWQMSIHSFPGSPVFPALPLVSPMYPQLGVSKSLLPSSMTRSGDSDTSHQVLLMKGAPDVLLLKCSHYLDELGDIQVVNEEFMIQVNKAYTEFAAQGERAIGFAMRILKKTLQEEETKDPLFRNNLKEFLVKKDPAAADMCFIGLISLVDPPRPEVAAAVSACHTAGIKVVMVTGDHPITASSIARKIGLITKPTRDSLALQRDLPKEQIPEADVRAVVVHGSEINNMTAADWQCLMAKDEIVFARTSPEHKLTIVKQFAAAGHIVAMTGDGVNDAPALRQAAIGVAMGKNGSDVAREAADIILLDDNFASIVAAIKEGRLLFDNLKKSVAYTVSHLLPEVTPVLLFFTIGCPLGMPAIMALSIDLLTELLPATSLAFEEPEADIMLRAPRDLLTDKLVAPPLLFYSYMIAGMFETIACFMVYFEVFEWHGISAAQLLVSDNRYFKDDSPTMTADLTGQEYDADQQQYILHKVQSAFFLTVVCAQACHIFQVRARTTSVFSHGLFGNYHTNMGVCCAVLLGLIVVYVPITQHSVFHSEAAPSLAVLRGTVLAGALIWGYNEGRKLFHHLYPNHPINKYINW